MMKPRIALAAAGALLAGAGTLSTAGPAWADYGSGAVYQIELSANLSGPPGGGLWLWIELNRGGTGDYQGADCGHGGVGSVHDSGDVTWSASSGQIVVTGVVLNGLGGFPATITAPAATGHYKGTIGSFSTLPSFIPSSAGNSQLQVAP
jgi:hypothetical protein